MQKFIVGCLNLIKNQQLTISSLITYKTSHYWGGRIVYISVPINVFLSLYSNGIKLLSGQRECWSYSYSNCFSEKPFYLEKAIPTLSSTVLSKFISSYSVIYIKLLAVKIRSGQETQTSRVIRSASLPLQTTMS